MTSPTPSPRTTTWTWTETKRDIFVRRETTYAKETRVCISRANKAASVNARTSLSIRRASTVQKVDVDDASLVEPEVHDGADVDDAVVVRGELVEVVEVVEHDVVLHPPFS